MNAYRIVSRVVRNVPSRPVDGLVVTPEPIDVAVEDLVGLPEHITEGRMFIDRKFPTHGDELGVYRNTRTGEFVAL
jgi:hypothetical protein